MKIGNFKNKISIILIVCLLLTNIVYAGEFFSENGITKYKNDDGEVMKNTWLWIDRNNDNICECYRFGKDGELVTDEDIHGKKTNHLGQWVENGIVQKIYKTTGKPLNTNADINAIENNTEYVHIATGDSIKMINTTDKDIKALILNDINMNDEKAREQLIGPKATFSAPEKGYILGKGKGGKEVSFRVVPVATRSSWGLIDSDLKEEEIRYLSATESIAAGKDMRKFVSNSNKYNEKVDNVKIYGGEIWNDAICLSGNGATVKFTTTSDKAKNFQANYFKFEVAHQQHGESTADTYCGVEIYLNGKSIGIYDDFCDGEPEMVEEWLDDGEKTVELKAVVTGDAPGRKIYIRNAVFRMIKEKNDDD